MRQLKIDLSELELAFTSGSEMISYFLDLEIGKVISIPDDERGLLESIYESYYDEQTETVDWEKAFLEERVPDWQQVLLQDADRVEADSGSRFIAIPSEDSHEGYRDMEAFIGTVRDRGLQERLERAIRGRGAFRYFKDILLDYPAERERWFQFKQERLHQRILDWLLAHEITPL
ncbi:MAG: hypothetical protein EHM70_14205 [Chloroflexota bacterium]|nr:MAG: hypothetical protein EHM70_14205 [Chloroflexota bacterium]